MMASLLTKEQMIHAVRDLRMHINKIMGELCNLLSHYEKELGDIDVDRINELRKNGVQPIY